MSVTVFKNTIWLVFPQLLLNALSIFAVGYMARVLGREDYGKFVFTFAFVGMFSPFINMGLRAVTVREIARGRDDEQMFVGKIIAIQLVQALICIVAVVGIINLLGYPVDTKRMVYLAAVTILFHAVNTTIQDVFQAHERMKILAHSQFIGGFGLTVFSVVVLFLGFRLIGITCVYVLGILLTLLVSSIYYVKYFRVPRLVVDFQFWRNNLRIAAPFFLLTILASIGSKISVVILSKMAGDEAVGLYGAANGLIEKLMIIPDSVCTAFFPSMIILHKQSADAAALLFRRVFLYLVLLGLPIAIGTIILAQPIILLIYGSKFVNAVPVLCILAFWLFITFLTILQGWTMGAIGQEKKVVVVSLITTPLYIALSFAFIPMYQEIGAGLAALISACLTLLILRRYTQKYMPSKMADMRRSVKVAVANVLMGVSAYLLKDIVIVIPVIVSIVVYSGALLALRVFTPGEIADFKKLLRKRFNISESRIPHDE